MSKNLRALTGDPNDILVDLIKGVGSFNFNGDILAQMKSLARSSAVNLGQTIASSVHPLLGAVFAVFASVFGWGGADEGSNMAEKILQQVDKMIKGSLRNFNQKLVQEELSGTLETINAAGTNRTRWGQVPVTVASSFPKVFKECWTNRVSQACQNWRGGRGAGAGASLVMEIQFTALMITSGATVARYNHKFLEYAKKINTAAELTRQHYAAFREARRNFRSTTTGLRKGTVSCAGRSNNKTCKTNPSRDLLLAEDFCGAGESKCSSASCSSRKAASERSLNTCVAQYEQRINSELNRLQSQTQAAQTAAKGILQSQGR